MLNHRNLPQNGDIRSLKKGRRVSTKHLSDLELIHKINKHPAIRENIINILTIAEASLNGITRADDIEEKVIGEMRKLGKDTMKSWAVSQEQSLATEATNDLLLKKHSKKKSTGTLLMDQSQS